MTALIDGKAAVVFDFFGTLTPVSPAAAWADNTARLAAVMGVPAPALRQALEESFGERITGALGDQAQTMQTLADRLGTPLSHEQLHAVVALRTQQQESMFALRPEALPVLTALRAGGLKIGLVSDCTFELADAWPRLAVSRLVDAPVFSCVERTRKPDPHLFGKVAADLPAKPAECLYLGDGGGRELTGATALGMHAVLLAGPDWRLNTARDREVGWTGTRIGSLTELCP